MSFPPTLEPPTLPELPDTESLLRWTDATPIGFAGVVGVVGIVLLFAGARLYRLALVAPGVAAGIYLAGLIDSTMDRTTALIVAVTLALTGALVCYFIEKVAVRGIGFVVTAITLNAAWPLLQPTPAPWWALVLAGLVGVLLFPYLFKPLMRLVTAALGAVLLAWAAGLADDLLVMGALTLVGFLVQMTDALLAKRRGGQKKKEKARDAEETG